MKERVMYCKKCGNEISDDARFCPKCGASLSKDFASSEQSFSNPSANATTSDLVYPRNPPCSPHVAWWCLLWPGISHILLGQKAKGIVLMIASSLISFLSAGSLAILVIIPSVIDAFCVGKALANGKPVGKWELFPSAK